MTRYLNITNRGLSVATRPSQKTLGKAEIPNLAIEINKTMKTGTVIQLYPDARRMAG